MKLKYFHFLALAVTAVTSGCTVDGTYSERPRYDDRPDVVVVDRDRIERERWERERWEREHPGQVYVVPEPVPAPPPPPPPVVYAPAPAPVIIVREAPPPLRVEGRPHAPGRDYVWIDGYWDRRGDHWFWVGGRWDRPPHSGAVWVPHHWERHGDEFHLTVGFWK